jgi:hypothetical protein
MRPELPLFERTLTDAAVSKCEHNLLFSYFSQARGGEVDMEVQIEKSRQSGLEEASVASCGTSSVCARRS